MAEWHFVEQVKGSITRNQTDTHLFTDSISVNDDEYAGTSYLVREVIPNSPDVGVLANNPERDQKRDVLYSTGISSKAFTRSSSVLINTLQPCC